MFRPRVIPVLLLQNLGLVKTIKFNKPRYIGDPINAVKIFNDLKADELIFLDIGASREKRKISLDFVKKVGAEANMPFAVGGGIKTVTDIKEIINAGAEKVVLNTSTFENPDIVKKASQEFGSSTIVVSIDVKKRFLRGEQVFVCGGTKPTGEKPLEYAKKMERLGAGEIIINSIEHDGVMNGYNIELIKEISKMTNSTVASCGAGKYSDFSKAIHDGYSSAVAADPYSFITDLEMLF